MAKSKKKSIKNLVQLPSGSWRIRYVDEQGRRRTATHKQKHDAELALARAQVEVEEHRRGLRQMRPVDVRLSDIWTVWRREVGEHKRSAVTDESLWKHHLAPELGALGVGEIGGGHIAGFRERSGSLGLTESTLHVLRTRCSTSIPTATEPSPCARTRGAT